MHALELHPATSRCYGAESFTFASKPVTNAFALQAPPCLPRGGRSKSADVHWLDEGAFACPETGEGHDTWLIPASAGAPQLACPGDAGELQRVQRCLQDFLLYLERRAPFIPPLARTDAVSLLSACVALDAAPAASLSFSLDLELSPDEVVWLVQPPALPASGTPAGATPNTTSAPKQRRPVKALLRGACKLRRCGGKLARAVRGKLAAVACLAQSTVRDDDCAASN